MDVGFLRYGKHGALQALVDCPSCGVERWVWLSHGLPKYTLCRKCSKPAGPSNQNWRGGRTIIQGGYARVYTYNTGSRKYIDEHRAIIEDIIGRELSSSEVIHHVDGDRLNNAVSNLQITTQSEHMRLHKAGLGECKHGHKFDETNTYFTPRGRRACKECGRIRVRAYRRKKEIVFNG